MRSWAVKHALAIAFLITGCSRSAVPSADGGALDSSELGDAGSICGVATCRDDERCYQAACIPNNGECRGAEPCEGDSVCDCERIGTDGGRPCEGICIPYDTGGASSFDGTCSSAFPSSEFANPEEACHVAWPANDGPITTPIVADLDGNGSPEITFISYGCTLASFHADCTSYFQVQTGCIPDPQLAVADLDGDGQPEIVSVNNLRAEVFDRRGAQLAVSPEPYRFDPSGAGPLGGAALVDVDGVPPAEIVLAGQVLRYVPGSPDLQVLWSITAQPAMLAIMSVAADVDGDGLPEVIVGSSIRDGISGLDKTPPELMAATTLIGALSGIADFNRDGKPEIVFTRQVHGSGAIAVYDVANRKFLLGPALVDYPYDFNGSPTIADFDGDGRPEIGVAGGHRYMMFDLDCLGPRLQAGCDPNEKPGVRWSRPYTENSAGTAASAFDLNGDGRAEVIVRDECRLRVYDGNDGHTLMAPSYSSGTGAELGAVVADVDGDGHAEIIVTADTVNMPKACNDPGTPDPDAARFPWTGWKSGVYVLRDPLRRWMPARSTWNQHTYHVTNVNDDLSIPAHEAPNWAKSNTFRAQVGGTPPGLPDATAGRASDFEAGQDDCSKAWLLRANICNRGAAPLAKGTPGSFYPADPTQASVAAICTANTTTTLAAGTCETVACTDHEPPTMPIDLWFRANDDGEGGSPATECHRDNNLLHLPGASCMAVR